MTVIAAIEDTLKALRPVDQSQAKAAAKVLNEALNLAVTQGHEDPENEIRALLADIAS